jgi:hypothetical protein
MHISKCSGIMAMRLNLIISQHAVTTAVKWRGSIAHSLLNSSPKSVKNRFFPLSGIFILIGPNEAAATRPEKLIKAIYRIQSHKFQAFYCYFIVLVIIKGLGTRPFLTQKTVLVLDQEQYTLNTCSFGFWPLRKCV